MRLMEKIQIRYSATSSPSTIRQAPSQAQQDGLNRTMFRGVRNGSGMATKDLQNHPKPTFFNGLLIYNFTYLAQGKGHVQRQVFQQYRLWFPMVFA
jgi:hypothetical protein